MKSPKPKHATKTAQIAARVPKEYKERLVEFSLEHGLPESWAIQKILEIGMPIFFRNPFKKNERTV